MAKAWAWALLIAVAALIAAGMAAGCGSGEDTAKGGAGGNSLAVERVERDAVQRYKWYLEGAAIVLVEQVRRLQQEIAAGEVSAARLTYAAARVAYGHLLPAAALFGALGPQIDGSAGKKLVGLHGVARAMSREEGIVGIEPVADRLVASARQMRRAIPPTELQPLEIARAGDRLMDAISTRMVAGKEEPYAHDDLVDISAGLEGDQRAFEALRPLLASSNPNLVLRIEAQFVSAYERLAEHGAPARQDPQKKTAAGSNFVPYGDMRPEQLHLFGAPLRALAALFSEIPSQLPQP